MQASVWAPVTTSRPTPALASTSSRSVSSKESPYVLCTSGSESSRFSSGTYSHSCEPFSSSASLCWTQTTGTPSARALSTRLLMLLMTRLRALPQLGVIVLDAAGGHAFWRGLVAQTVDVADVAVARVGPGPDAVRDIDPNQGRLGAISEGGHGVTLASALGPVLSYGRSR